MNFLKSLTARLKLLGQKPNKGEYFFALNIGPQSLKNCLWTIEDSHLKVFNIAKTTYSSSEGLIQATDQLLDQSLEDLVDEPSKILFGVPDSWLVDDDLKSAYLKLLRHLVKELEIRPMAYVATSHALAHFLENQEGVPATAILVGTDESYLSVSVVRAGKIDGTKVISRGDSIGQDIEKALLLFTDVEVLPSRILLFSNGDLSNQKESLLSYSWMSRLSFLHFPKIDVLEEDVEIKAVALAGASELQENVKYSPQKITIPQVATTRPLIKEDQSIIRSEMSNEEGVGFMVGDVLERVKEEEHQKSVSPPPQPPTDVLAEEFASKPIRISWLPQLGLPNLGGKRLLILPIIVFISAILFYLLLTQAKVMVFVEPQILEKDAQVIADPKISKIDEGAKKIPGQLTETQVSESDKTAATGKKQTGDKASGTVMIYNKTDSAKTFAKGVIFVGPDGLKFTLDSNVTVASQSAVEGGITFGKSQAQVTALEIGPEGNLSSGTQLSVTPFPTSQFSAKGEGNFSGGTSKEVTVVTDGDQKKLLVTLAANLRKKAQEELQKKLPGKKVLEEALSEEIVKKSYSKGVGDQTLEFSLNLTVRYKGTAYSEEDLKRIMAKVIERAIPADLELNLAETETQADVSKLEKDGKLVFLARFKAKLMPKIDQAKIKKNLVGKTPQQAAEILKTYDNVLGSEIKITPSLPKPLARLPLLEQNIKIEVGLK